MLDFGVQEKWPTKLVERKWEQILFAPNETVRPNNAHLPTLDRSLIMPSAAGPFETPSVQSIGEDSLATDGGLHLGYE